jgi:AsmA protein
MKKLFKWVFLGGAAAGLLAITGAVFLALTFDPNRYKGDLEQLAKEHTGRTLKLRGKLELAFFPSVGAKVAGVTFSERNSEQEFVSLESAHASVKVLPLFSGEVVVDAIRITGLKAQIIQGKDGRFNFDDLLGGAPEAGKPAPVAKAPVAAEAPSKPAAGTKTAPGKPPAGPVSFQVAGLRLERSAITYRDVVTGNDVAFTDVRLSTGRVAEASRGKLTFGATAKGIQPAVDARVELRADYEIALPERIALANLELNLSGSAAGMTGLELLARGDVTSDLPRHQYRIGNLSLQFKGANGADRLEGLVTLAGARGSERTLTVPKFTADITLASPDLPAAIRPLRIPLAGSVKANFEKQTASAELAGKIDESTLKAKLGLTRFTPASYQFDLDVDKLNIDRYLVAEPAAARPPAPVEKTTEKAPPKAVEKPASKPAATTAETPVDLSGLKGLNAAGKLRIGELQVRGLRLAEVVAEARAANGRVDIAPHSAKLYQGSVTGALSLDADGNRVALKETLTDVAIGPLLKDVAQKAYVEGRGSVSLDVAAAGASVEAMKRALGGTAQVHLREGTLQGFDALEILKKAQSMVGAQTAQGSGKGEATGFGELKASFVIKEGVARNEDLDVQAPGLRIVGSGSIDVGRSRVDYRMIPRLVTTKDGRGVEAPVHLSGAFDDLKYEVNYGQVVRDVVRNLGRSVRDRVKGLLGR